MRRQTDCSNSCVQLCWSFQLYQGNIVIDGARAVITRMSDHSFSRYILFWPFWDISVVFSYSNRIVRSLSAKHKKVVRLSDYDMSLRSRRGGGREEEEPHPHFFFFFCPFAPDHRAACGGARSKSLEDSIFSRFHRFNSWTAKRSGNLYLWIKIKSF